MKVLVAKNAGTTSTDFCWLPDGEIVCEPLIICCNSQYCGCSRSFTGTSTLKATTTAQVVDLPLNDDDIAELIGTMGERSGFGNSVAECVIGTLTAASELPLGALIRGEYDFDSQEWVYLILP